MAHEEAGQAQYEFRAFDVDLTTVADALRPISSKTDQSSSVEAYIVTRLSLDTGLKLRDGRAELKELVLRQGLLEYWRLVLSEAIPLSSATLVDVIAPRLGVEFDIPRTSSLDESALTAIVSRTPQLGWVKLSKLRTRFMVENGSAEVVEITLPATKLQSAAVESPDPQRALELMGIAGIETRDNESYAARLQRLLFT